VVTISAILSGSLPDTATYHHRRWEWTPRVGDECDDRDGTLAIWQTRGSRPEFDAYAVQEDGPRPGVMGRVFLLLNLGSEGGDVYETVIGPTAYCTCRAGQTRTPLCKHRDSLAAAIDAGGLSNVGW
jgi:hypothetical protein